jgi:hypothetical protein
MLMAGVKSGEFDEDEYVSWQFHQQNAKATPHANVTLKMSKNGCVPTMWILLDNQSTVNVFHNPEQYNFSSREAFSEQNSLCYVSPE